jgi:hypothetical protein
MTVKELSILSLVANVLSFAAHAQIMPLEPCCENRQAEVLRADQNTSAKPWPGCPPYETSITARECVDRTRLEHLCSPGGSRFCKETDGTYPRYYAVAPPIPANPASFNFFAIKGGTNPSSQSTSLSNAVFVTLGVTEDSVMPWAASSNQQWLYTIPSSGQIQQNTPVGVTVSVNVAGLAEGVYSGSITVTSSKVSDYQHTYITVHLSVFGTTISGPTNLSCNQSGTWTASVAGGTPPYHYQWYYYIPCNTPLQASLDGSKPLLPPCGYWYQAGADNSTFSHGACSDFEVKCVVHDALNS